MFQSRVFMKKMTKKLFLNYRDTKGQITNIAKKLLDSNYLYILYELDNLIVFYNYEDDYELDLFYAENITKEVTEKDIQELNKYLNADITQLQNPVYRFKKENQKSTRVSDLHEEGIVNKTKGKRIIRAVDNIFYDTYSTEDLTLYKLINLVKKDNDSKGLSYLKNIIVDNIEYPEDRELTEIDAFLLGLIDFLVVDNETFRQLKKSYRGIGNNMFKQIIENLRYVYSHYLYVKADTESEYIQLFVRDKKLFKVGEEENVIENLWELPKSYFDRLNGLLFTDEIPLNIIYPEENFVEINYYGLIYQVLDVDVHETLQWLFKNKPYNKKVNLFEIDGSIIQAYGKVYVNGVKLKEEKLKQYEG